MSIRDSLTSEQRSISLTMTIDPGFVHHRKIETILGLEGTEIINNLIRKIPNNIPEWQKPIQIDHIYTRIFLDFCNGIGIKSLLELLANEEGTLFCSVEKLKPCGDLFDKSRVISHWIPQRKFTRKVEFHYSTDKIKSDTLKSRLHHGENKFAIIAELVNVLKSRLVFDPIIMGFPWLVDNEKKANFDIMWYGLSFYENFIEDFDEFAKVKDVLLPIDTEPMLYISEKAFKVCLSKILGGVVDNDWGGEISDYFSSHIHLNGNRMTAAFLLKGPAKFRPMGLNHLGKNNDQIVRLAHEPAQILFVQHSHEILQSVRETLRAFAVQPSNPRRYCLIDGRDSLRLLMAYDLYDYAVELSKNKM